MLDGRSTTIKVIPSASRLTRSLRDLGYDFPQAVADLIDNSIAAEATRITIDLHFDGPDSWLRVTDNGAGMSAGAITEALRYGSQQSYEDDALGKFGLGLKTASLSQCRRLSVASRSAPLRLRIAVRELDLDHVIDSDSWEIFVVDPRHYGPRLTEPLRKGPGTVVLWQSLDRVLGYKIPWGKRARSALDSLAEQLALHLGMVFHRFIAGEIEGQRKVRILVNGRLVKPWNPFARDERATLSLPGCDVDVQTAEGAGLVRFQPYVLPPKESFSSEERFHLAGGPRKWNAQQGFYIYRANRLIQSGGWCRMRALDEHIKLARASIDFYPDLDCAFEINVAKVRVALPADLRDRLKGHLEHLIRVAQARYRESASGNDEEQAGLLRRTSMTARPALEDAARNIGEIRALRRIARQLSKSSPQVARQLGW